MKTFWLVKLPVLLLGTIEVTVFREWALHNQVPLSATQRMQHEVTDQRSARIEA